MSSDQTFVIVGASLAGAKAAETLRSQGFGGRLLPIGAEQLDRGGKVVVIGAGWIGAEVVRGRDGVLRLRPSMGPGCVPRRPR